MLHVESINHLYDGLGPLLKHTHVVGDPLSQDWIICPHLMMCKWVQEHIANQKEICVQIDAFSLSKWTHILYQLIGVDSNLIPSESRLVWSILKTLDHVDDQHPNAPLFQQLFGKSATQKSQVLAGSRYQIAQKLARELKRCLSHHPEWIKAWDQNHDHLVGKLDPQWWPSLWRAIRPHLGSILIDPTQAAVHLIRQHSHLITNRVRTLFFYGHHRFDRSTWRLIEELSHHLPVYCFNLDPLTHQPNQTSFTEPFASYLTLYPPPFLTALHASSQTSLPTYETRYIQSTKKGFFFQNPPLHRLSSSLTHSSSLLSTLQSDLVNQKETGPPQKKTLPLDYSLQFHSCHSRLRQVETLYQSLCASFRRDPTLNPRDILVLCPDIDTLIPLITAIFSGENERLGAEIARPHGANPFADLLIQLMQLSKSRLYRYDVFQLLKHPLVSHRFKLELSDILQVESWLKRSGVRWGLDSEHRLDVGLNESDQHTWQFGLDRILMGLLVGDEANLFEEVLPFSVVDGDEILTKFFDFFVVFQDLVVDFKATHTARKWTQLLVRAVRCLTSPRIESTWLRQELEQDLYQNLARSSNPHLKLKPSAVLNILETGLGRKSQITGGGQDHVRFYPLDQAYGVPAKVICFLDVSQGQFPTVSSSSPLDLLSQSPSLNLIDPFKEQQSNFLFSFLASQTQLQFFYTGQHIKGDHLTPCPLVLSLQEEVKERYRLQISDQHYVEDVELIEALTQEHTLHPFSPRNFHADENHLPTEHTISHEPLWLESAQVWRSAQRNPQVRPPFSDSPLSSPSRGVNRVRLDLLARFLKNPSEFFLKRGVGLHLMKEELTHREREMLELDSLQTWSLKDQTLSLFLNLDKEGINPKTSPQLVFEHVRAQGLLPMGGMGKVSFEKAFEEICTLFDTYKTVRQSKTKTHLSLGLDLPSGTPLRVEGDQLFEDQLIFMNPSRHRLAEKDQTQAPLYRGKHLLQPWLYHVALCASERPYIGTTLIGLDGQFTQFPHLEQAQASSLLDSWVQCLEKGLTQPIRFDPDLSLNYLQFRRRVEDDTLLQKEITSKRAYENTCSNLYVQQAFDGSNFIQNQEGIHPEFDQTARLIFGPLEDALYQAEFHKESSPYVSTSL